MVHCMRASDTEVQAVRMLMIGAGVIGVTTAYRLTQSGHEVEVLDGAREPASGASGVNAGLLVPGDALVWATPQAPALLIHALMGRSAFLRVRRGAGPALVP